MDRRKFLRSAAAGAIAGSVASTLFTEPTQAMTGHIDRRVDHQPSADDVLAQVYPFTLPMLGYANSALEPAVDALTMSIHHDKHHAAYVTNLNKALETQPSLHTKTLRQLLTGLAGLPEAARNAVRNNGGGHANHALFWQLLAPGGAKAPSGALLSAINRDFGSMAACLAALKAVGVAQFGSGWTWLIRDGGGKLSVRGTPNQDTPLSDGARVLIGVDVWEHAYYLKYQNRRADYLDAVLGLLNWDVAAKAFSD